MALVRLSARSKIYDVVKMWESDCLQQDHSLFNTSSSVWNLENLQTVQNRFSLAQDSSADSFLTKLERQIGPAPNLVIQLMAEILFIYFLPAVPEAVRGAKKREIISKVLAWMPTKISIPPDLDNILDSGIWHPGVAFNAMRPNHLRFIVTFALAWKNSTLSKRSEFLNDPWRFKEFLLDLPIDSAFVQRDALLHLFFPESFEDIVSRDAKKRITKELARLVSEPTDDVDRALLQIRRKLSVEHSNEFTFYDPHIIKLWQPDASPWGRFIAWAERFYSWGKYSSEEREYKIDIGNRLAAVANCIGSETEDWRKLLKQAFSPPKNNLVHYMTVQRFLEWTEQNPEARSSLSNLWKGAEPIEDRIQTFLKRLPKVPLMHGPSQRVSILSVLLMGLDPTQYATYRATPYKAGYRLTGEDAPASEADHFNVYQHAMAFLDKFISEASSRGLELKDRLDAQNLLWMITQGTPTAYKDLLGEDGIAALEKYREGKVDIDPDDPAEEEIEISPFVVKSTVPDMASLANELMLEQSFLENIGQLLEKKGQLIFYGPPGTGKTFVAKRLAELYAHSKENIRIVQFHPSYSYEDFVEGYRPRKIGGQAGFDLMPGPLKRIAVAAAQAQGTKHILIIDEINRTNLAKVFGELYFLLEYRNESISLQYSEDEFSFPENLWIIGTMNTADRSIALVDNALRRRFYFVPFYPDEPPIKGLLSRWLGKFKPDMLWVADVLDEANALMGERHFAIGPSHFLRKDLSEDWVKRIWDYSIMPYLAEHFFGNEDRLSEFNLARLRERVRSRNGSNAAAVSQT
jgi:5-methylcytosine-specific restriction enzyme B